MHGFCLDLEVLISDSKKSSRASTEEYTVGQIVDAFLGKFDSDSKFLSNFPILCIVSYVFFCSTLYWGTGSTPPFMCFVQNCQFVCHVNNCIYIYGVDREYQGETY